MCKITSILFMCFVLFLLMCFVLFNTLTYNKGNTRKFLKFDRQLKKLMEKRILDQNPQLAQEGRVIISPNKFSDGYYLNIFISSNKKTNVLLEDTIKEFCAKHNLVSICINISSKSQIQMDLSFFSELNLKSLSFLMGRDQVFDYSKIKSGTLKKMTLSIRDKKQLQSLPDAPNLETLDLRGSIKYINPNLLNLRNIYKYPKLKEISLVNFEVEGELSKEQQNNIVSVKLNNYYNSLHILSQIPNVRKLCLLNASELDLNKLALQVPDIEFLTIHVTNRPRLKSPQAINKFSKLYFLDCGSIASDVMIKNMQNLKIKFLDLGYPGNRVSSLAPLSKMNSLKYLDISEIQVKDISPLKNLKLDYLRVKNIADNKFEDFRAKKIIDKPNQEFLSYFRENIN